MHTEVIGGDEGLVRLDSLLRMDRSLAAIHPDIREQLADYVLDMARAAASQEPWND